MKITTNLVTLEAAHIEKHNSFWELSTTLLHKCLATSLTIKKLIYGQLDVLHMRCLQIAHLFTTNKNKKLWKKSLMVATIPKWSTTTNSETLLINYCRSKARGDKAATKCLITLSLKTSLEEAVRFDELIFFI